MNEKILLDDKKSTNLEDLVSEVNRIIEALENEKNLENSISNYQKLIKLNNIIEKKFMGKSKEISQVTKEKITRILKKNDKNRKNR
jgi:exonuclease VII small subunit|tara:strand:+ start:279 stop:536 length:258 start_codon:yes stop_codon:yes gene_type:complete